MSSVELPPLSSEVVWDVSQMKGAVKEAVAGSQQYAKATDKAMSEAAAAAKRTAEKTTSSYKEMLEKIKGETGKRSAFGESVELLAGGGIVAGFSMAGSQLHDFTKNLVDLKTQLNATGGDWSTMIDKVGASIPIFGQFWEAGRDIRELFTGEKAELEKLNQEMKAYDDAIALSHKVSQEIIENNREHAQSIHELIEAYSLLGKKGLSRDLLEITNATSDRIQDAYAKTGLNALNPEQLEDYKKTLKEIKDLGAMPGPSLEGTKKWLAANDQALAMGLGNLTAEAQKMMDAGYGHRDDDALDDWFRKMQPLKSAQSSYKKLMDDADKNAQSTKSVSTFLGLAQAADLFKSKWTDAVDGWAENFKKRAEENRAAISKNMIDVMKETRQAGMTDSQKMLDDFKVKSGVTPTDVNQYKKDLAARDAAIKSADNTRSFDEKVSSMVEGIKSPHEKYMETMANWQLAFSMGKINPSQLMAGVAQAYTQTIGASDQNYHRPGLIYAGSAEAQAAKFDGGRKVDPIVEVAKDHLKVSQETQKVMTDFFNRFPTLAAVEVITLSL